MVGRAQCFIHEIVRLRKREEGSVERIRRVSSRCSGRAAPPARVAACASATMTMAMPPSTLGIDHVHRVFSHRRGLSHAAVSTGF